jgi:histidinol phosphatase-like enzyme
MLFIASTKYDKYQKPGKAMWDFMVNKIMPEGALIDMENSFYCGNKVGRSSDHLTGKKFQANRHDLSNTDLKFAIKIGIKLETP